MQRRFENSEFFMKIHEFKINWILSSANYEFITVRRLVEIYSTANYEVHNLAKKWPVPGSFDARRPLLTGHFRRRI